MLEQKYKSSPTNVHTDLTALIQNAIFRYLQDVVDGVCAKFVYDENAILNVSMRVECVSVYRSVFLCTCFFVHLV